MSGRPGPVVLALPEDMLGTRAECADVARVEAICAAPAADQVAGAHAMLARAARPLALPIVLLCRGSRRSARPLLPIRSQPHTRCWRAPRGRWSSSAAVVGIRMLAPRCGVSRKTRYYSMLCVFCYN